MTCTRETSWNRIRRIGLLVLLISSLSDALLAQRDDRPYVSIQGGLSLLQDVEFTTTESFFPATAEVEFDTGFRGDVAFGYLLRRGGLFAYKSWYANFDIAAELSAGFLYNKGTGNGGFQSGGMGLNLDLFQMPVLANVVFRLPLSERFSVGTGAGLGGLVSIIDANSPMGESSDEDIVFAWQVMADIGYEFNDHLALMAGYKLLGTAQGEYSGDIPVETESMFNHFLGLTLRWRF